MTETAPERMQENLEEWKNATDGIRQFADALIRGTLEHLQEIDEELARQTAHWRLERLAAVDRNILRLAMYELLFHADTPHAVVIDEAIEIAKKYGAGESARFVNGVLDGFVKRRAQVG
jgi:N utilization substance protein B